MNKLEMKFCGDLVLREVCTPVTEITPDIKKTLDDMVKMMYEKEGVGLAAPQVGINQRFLVMINPNNKEVIKMINPVIVEKSEALCVMEEGCLSVLGGDGIPVYADVERPESVTVEWTDENGEKQRSKAKKYKARIVQHEMDHLDGVLFIDHLSPIKREQIMSKVRKFKA